MNNCSAIQRRCVEKGEEGELIFIDFQVVLNRIWRGDFAAAARVTDDASGTGAPAGGDFPVMLSLVSERGSPSSAVRRTLARCVADAIDATKGC